LLVPFSAFGRLSGMESFAVLSLSHGLSAQLVAMVLLCFMILEAILKLFFLSFASGGQLLKKLDK